MTRTPDRPRRRRTTSKLVRFRERELAEAKRRASYLDLSVEEYIRQRTLEPDPRVPEPEPPAPKGRR